MGRSLFDRNKSGRENSMFYLRRSQQLRNKSCSEFRNSGIILLFESKETTMQRIILILAVFLSLNSFAQEFETNDEGHAYYSDVPNVEGQSASDLFQRGIEWINEYYVNPNGVIKEKDATKMLIKGKARIRLNTYDKKGNVMVGGGFVSYHLKMYFKDGRYKYEIERISWEKPSYYDVTRWNDKSQVGYNEENYNFYKTQVIEYVEKTTDSMIDYMANGKEEKVDEW